MLRDAVRGQRRDVGLASALVIVHQAAEVAVPLAIGVIIDRAVATGDGAAITRWMVGLVVLFALLSSAGCYGIYVHDRVVARATHDVRLRVARRVLDPGGGVEDALPGEVVSLSTVETTRIGEGVGGVVVAVGGVAGVLAGAGVLLATSLTLGAVVVVGLPVVMLAVQAMSQPLVARADAHQEAVATTAGVAADLLAGLRVLKGLGAEAAAGGRYRRSSGEALGAALAANRVRSAYLGVTLSAAGAFLVLVAWVGGRQALDGSITVGELVAAIGITQFLIGPLSRLAYVAGVLAQARASSAHVAAALTAPPAARGGDGDLPAPAARPAGTNGDVTSAAARGGDGTNGSRGGDPTTAAARSGDGTGGSGGRTGDGTGGHRPRAGGGGHALTLRGVRHGTLQGLDLEVAAGELVGIVTTDPADAAALVACLDRSVDLAEGEVAVDGTPLAAVGLDAARRAVVVAHHEATLFEGTLGDNVAAAAGAGVDLGAAIEAAGADAVVDTVPGGLDAPVAESGRSLSGGQRQRVALARALATDAPVLVLHEPTTAVDAATEHRVAAGLRALRAGRRTTVLVTTSPGLLAVADRVVVVDGGRVAAGGDHAQLAASDERYRTAVLT